MPPEKIDSLADDMKSMVLDLLRQNSRVHGAHRRAGHEALALRAVPLSRDCLGAHGNHFS